MTLIKFLCLHSTVISRAVDKKKRQGSHQLQLFPAGAVGGKVAQDGQVAVAVDAVAVDLLDTLPRLKACSSCP